MRVEGRLALTLILICLGAGWGMTIPLIKIIVEAGYPPLAIVFWQFVIISFLLAALIARRGTWPPVGRVPLLVWLFIALVGTLIPNAASYRATLFLPAGVMAIIIASVPMFALPIALLLGTDRLSFVRLLGLCAGLAGVALIALPEASLPDRSMAAFLPLALIAPFCYAVEANVVGKWGTGPLDPVQVLFGASVLGAVLTLPLALATGQWAAPQTPYDVADVTLVVTGLIHGAVYTAYVWLVGRAGAVFAGQVAYLVTGFGVIWSILLLGERYSGWVWAALLLMLAGLALVQPRERLESDATPGDTAPTSAKGR